MAKKSKSDKVRPVAIVVSRYNGEVTVKMLEGAVDVYTRRGGRQEDLGVVEVAGAFELPTVCDRLADTELYWGVLALGCILKGETDHDRHLATAVTNGLVQVSIDYPTPVGFGVLTVDTMQQAKDRAGGEKGNKGAEAMEALLDAMAAMNAIDEVVESEEHGKLRYGLGRTVAKLGGSEA